MTMSRVVVWCAETSKRERKIMEQLLHTPFDEQRRKGYGVSKNVAGFGACPCCDESTVLVVAPEGSEKDDPRDYRFANHLLQGSSKPCLA
ncbi:MAG TPA: hypothetical protein VF803_02060, partial [Candidatus Paceibacterota bacterium]